MARRYGAWRERPATRRRRSLIALPRILRATGLDQGRIRSAGQRPARHDQPRPPGDRAPRATRGGPLLRRGGRRVPGGASRRLPRRPPRGAGRPPATVGPRPRVLRRLRVGREHPPDAGGGRSARQLRPARDRGRWTRAAPDRRPRHVPVRLRRRAGPLPLDRRARRHRGRAGRGPRALRDRSGAGARLHRPARRPVRWDPGRQGRGGQDRGRPAARARLAGGRAGARHRRNPTGAPQEPAGREGRHWSTTRTWQRSATPASSDPRTRRPIGRAAPRRRRSSG